ncbi:hypothetical protein ACHQM5_008481 [Ranunculus cassubicifolius]
MSSSTTSDAANDRVQTKPLYSTFNVHPSDYIVIPCADGQRVLSKGFRFSPLDLDVAKHYLKNKVFGNPLPCEVILQKDDLYSYDPDKLCLSEFGYAKDDEAYFFTYNSEKNNRTFSTNSGYWEAKREEPILDGCNIIANKKMFVFHEGKSPDGKKTNYVMKEYRLNPSLSLSSEDSTVKNKIENLVICKIRLRTPKTNLDLDVNMLEEIVEYADDEENDEEEQNTR